MSSLLPSSRGNAPDTHYRAISHDPLNNGTTAAEKVLNSSYGLVLPGLAVDVSPDGVGLAGSGVRRGRSVGAGVGVGAAEAGASLAPGVEGVLVAGAGIAEEGVAGVGVAGALVGAGASTVWVGSGSLLRQAAPTRRALPLITTKASTTPNEAAA